MDASHKKLTVVGVCSFQTLVEGTKLTFYKKQLHLYCGYLGNKATVSVSVLCPKLPMSTVHQLESVSSSLSSIQTITRQSVVHRSLVVRYDEAGPQE